MVRQQEYIEQQQKKKFYVSEPEGQLYGFPQQAIIDKDYDNVLQFRYSRE